VQGASVSRQAEDRLALAELVSRCGYLIDNFDIESWVETFAPDGSIDESAFGKGIHVGQDQIRAFGNGIVENTESVVHIMGNQVLWRLEELSASGTVSALVESVPRSGERSRVYVAYGHEFVRTETGWKIARRVLHKIMPAETIDTGFS
jgi:hypothetical protein